MRFRQRPVALSLLLLQFVPSILAAPPPSHVADVAEGKTPRDTADSAAVTGDALKVASGIGKKDPGTKDAPVDGKDGKPHQGPFIETEAERDRKKAKESGKDDSVASGKGSSGEKLSKEELGLGKGKGAGKDLPKDIPETNDGVMDDRNRQGPKEGTRGTEGGISEKSKGVLNSDEASVEKTPEEPKEAPPLPHSEQEKIEGDTTKPTKSSKTSKSSKEEDTTTAKTDDEKEKPKAKVEDLDGSGLSKPEDLPETPHNMPHPQPDSAPKDSLEIKAPSSPSSSTIKPADSTLIQPVHSFLLSLTMIIFAEIGDKTFLVAALMAMKHPPLLVLSAAFAALGIMTVLSAVLGHAVPSLLPPRVTAAAAAVLFLFFGAKMLREGLAMTEHDDHVGAEMKEVELELEQKEKLAQQLGRRRSSITPYMLESGRAGRKARANSRLPAPPASPPSSPDPSRSPSPSRGSVSGLLSGVHNLFSLLLSPAWVQTFVMTFLGEWGDRSQIATIAMSTGADYWWIAAGALVGHCLCTCVAVVGGRAIAGRVSMRVVTIGGAITFLVFGFIYLVEAYYQK